MTDRFETKKSLGQNFLNSAVVPNWLTEAGDVSMDDTVLEIGPGTGALTGALLGRGAQVIALEADHRAIEILNDKFSEYIASGQLQVIYKDVRHLDLSSLGLTDHSFKVISNIPYYLTGHLFRTFLSKKIQPSDLVFLIQKEVAKRVTANRQKGEKESLLSLSVQAFGIPKYIRSVGRGHFTPSPKVDSAIVAICDINRDRFRSVSTEKFFELLHLGFGSKRKQLVGNLSSEYDRQYLLRIFSKLGIADDVRAEDIGIDKWLALASNLTLPE